MENPHFSVVIPVFNKKKYVQHAIESVLHQENLSEVGGVELIVVDDGSTDGSYKIAEQTLQNVDIKKQVTHFNLSKESLQYDA